MKTTVNWGVLGAAAIAIGRTMPALQEARSATLLALASRDAAKGRAAADALGVPRVYAGYDALLADPDIDAVYVPLPNQLHFEWAGRAMEAGKHVLCEKPLCLTADQVQQLCAVRDRTGRHIEEGFGFRNHPQWARLAELDYGDCHATLTVATQAGPSAWGTHQQLSVLGSTGWLRMDFPYAHARPTACSIALGDAGSVGSFPTQTFAFAPVNQYVLQVERFSRLLLGEPQPSWPIEDALGTLRTIEALFASARSGGWETLPH